MRCMRWEVSIAGTCEVGFAELTENHRARLIAELQGDIFTRSRSRQYGREYPDLDAPRPGKAAIR